MMKIRKRPAIDSAELTKKALMHHQSGDLDQAESAYRKIISDQPENFDALHMLGVLYAQQKKPDAAIRLIGKALKVNPRSAYANYNLGNVLRDNCRFEEAASYYRKVLELHRNDDTVLKDLGIDLQEVDLMDAIMSRNQTNKSVLISIPVFNRKKATRLSLSQTRRYKTASCLMQVYNDHSDEYDNAFLAPYADEVIQMPEKMGVNALRWHQFRQFLETDFDFIYMTDGDVIHDPSFMAALEVLYEAGGGRFPVCLFNSSFHMEPRIILYRAYGIVIKGTAPGVSMFYDRAMVEKIVEAASKNPTNDVWDYAALRYLGLPWINPEVSFLEHYGTGGIHNADNERDRAINPTEYLRARRAADLKYLMSDDDIGTDFSPLEEK